ncbi:MAG: restriction endonuclease subunit S [Fimbriiglobus sp.]
MTWPTVKLGEVLAERRERVGKPNADGLPLLGVSNVNGLHRSGLERIPDMSRYFFVKKDWFAYNPMRINVGSVGWAAHVEQTGVISPDYVVFSCTERVLAPLVFWFLKHRRGLVAINGETAGSVRDRLYFESLSRIDFPLPPLTEQRRLVSRIEALAAKLDEAKQVAATIEERNQDLLKSAFSEIIDNVPRRKLAEVAPLFRRPAKIDPLAEYPQVSVRSFGRGTFQNPPLQGSEITWEKPHLVEAGDILVSNIKAWEGAIAVAKPEDGGRFGSHRYLTYVPIPGVATARFVCFYLLSPEGLFQVGEASPGSADRNRTTSAKGLLEIPMPVPSYQRQVWFGELFDKVEMISQQQSEINEARNAMLPAILDRAFRGEL